MVMKHHHIVTYFGVEAYLHAIIALALVADESLISRFGRFDSERTASYNHRPGDLQSQSGTKISVCAGNGFMMV
jgi:hypothetical protein